MLYMSNRKHNYLDAARIPSYPHSREAEGANVENRLFNHSTTDTS